MREVAPGLLVGGSPLRLLRVKDGADPAAVQRLLISKGFVHPEPPADPGPADLTVVIPVRDRHVDISTLAAWWPVVVVDDGSADPVAGASIRHDRPLGPGAARQAGTALVRTPLVAFVDSDVTVTPAVLERLAWWLREDPSLAAVAPRVAGSGRWPCPLDLGPDPALVAPLSDVAYVPTACLVMRTDLVDFDPALRVGEDVDLVWRLLRDGHRVRYDPGAVVTHAEPGFRKRLRRRHSYGTSAPALHQRHPGQVAPLVVAPAATAALVLRSPALAGWVVGRSAQRLHASGVPVPVALRLGARGLAASALGLGQFSTTVGWPALVRTWPLAPLPHLRSWWRRRPPVDPVRWTLAGLAEDAAYGTGVWRAAVSARSWGALAPRLASRR